MISLLHIDFIDQRLVFKNLCAKKIPEIVLGLKKVGAVSLDLQEDGVLRVLLVVAFDVVPGGLMGAVAFGGQAGVDQLLHGRLVSCKVGIIKYGVFRCKKRRTIK